MYKVIVIGGGAAGMMAAATAAKQGAKVLLLERNEKLGKKLYITGKGRCNLTNDSDVENLLAHVVSNSRFLYSAFYGFGSSDMMAYMENLGVPLKTERGNRVFPVSDKSSDIIRALTSHLQSMGVEIRYRARVLRLLTWDGKIKGVIWTQEPQKEERNLAKLRTQAKGRGGEREEKADAVILATGGCSYASTGSTGDGYILAEEVGHDIVKPMPSLVPMVTEEDWVKRLQGLSMKNVTLCMREGHKVLYEEMGEMLFTHFGVSGPLVLSASTLYGKRKDASVTLHLDCKPALQAAQLDKRILRDFEKNKNSYIKNALGALLPAKLIPVMIELAGIAPDKRVNEITKGEREALVHRIKNLEMTVVGTRGFDEAIITRGGVGVGKVNPATMESKLLSGLYFAGEILDLDAMTGGYNLQIAWATAYAAGRQEGKIYV